MPNRHYNYLFAFIGAFHFIYCPLSDETEQKFMRISLAFLALFVMLSSNIYFQNDGTTLFAIFGVIFNGLFDFMTIIQAITAISFFAFGLSLLLVFFIDDARIWIVLESCLIINAIGQMIINGLVIKNDIGFFHVIISSFVLTISIFVLIKTAYQIHKKCTTSVDCQ